MDLFQNPERPPYTEYIDNTVQADIYVTSARLHKKERRPSKLLAQTIDAKKLDHQNGPPDFTAGQPLRTRGVCAEIQAPSICVLAPSGPR